MSEPKDIVQRLYDLYWCEDMNKRAIRADIAAEAATEITRLRGIVRTVRTLVSGIIALDYPLTRAELQALREEWYRWYEGTEWPPDFPLDEAHEKRMKAMG